MITHKIKLRLLVADMCVSHAEIFIEKPGILTRNKHVNLNNSSGESQLDNVILAIRLNYNCQLYFPTNQYGRYGNPS